MWLATISSLVLRSALIDLSFIVIFHGFKRDEHRM